MTREERELPFRIHVQGEVARLIGSGIVTAKELRDVIEPMRSEPALPASPKVMADLSRVSLVDLSNREIRSLVASIRDPSVAGARVALLAPSDHVYGMARMVQAHLDRTPVEVRVFREAKEADDWLRGPSEA